MIDLSPDYEVFERYQEEGGFLSRINKVEDENHVAPYKDLGTEEGVSLDNLEREVESEMYEAGRLAEREETIPELAVKEGTMEVMEALQFVFEGIL